MLRLEIFRQTVLCQHRKVVGCDHLRHTVVDFRVGMIRASGEDNALSAVLRHPVERLFAFRADIRLRGTLRLPGLMHRRAHFVFLNLICFTEEAHEVVCGDLFACQRKEGLEYPHAPLGYILDVVGDIFRIGDDHRAVEVILGVHVLLMLIEHARVEDGPDTLVNQPLHMTVRELRRIALALRRDGFHALFVYGAARHGRQHDAEAEPFEHRCPEGVVFVHVQHARNAELAARRVFGAQRLTVEHPLELVCYHIRRSVALDGLPESSFAAVAGDVPPSAGEKADGQHAVVRTALTACRASLPAQVKHLLKRQGARLVLACDVRIMLTGNQRRAERAHHTGNVRADDLNARELLKRAKHCLVVEGAALHDNVRTELLRVGELDDLEQRILDDRAGKSGADVLNGCALLLRLLDIGVHKHGAARAEVDRFGREQRLRREAFRRVAH